MHFIYLLPFSKTRALVESTIFSITHAEVYYVDTIHAYLMEQHHTTVVKVHHEEKGIIPMAPCPSRPLHPGPGQRWGHSSGQRLHLRVHSRANQAGYQ